MEKVFECSVSSPEGKVIADQIIGGDAVVNPCLDSVKEEEQNMSVAVSEPLISEKVSQPYMYSVLVLLTM